MGDITILPTVRNFLIERPRTNPAPSFHMLEDVINADEILKWTPADKGRYRVVGLWYLLKHCTLLQYLSKHLRHIDIIRSITAVSRRVNLFSALPLSKYRKDA